MCSKAGIKKVSNAYRVSRMQDVCRALAERYSGCVVRPVPKRYENGKYGISLFEVVPPSIPHVCSTFYFKLASAHEVDVVSKLKHPCIAKYERPIMWREGCTEALLPVRRYKEDLRTLLEREGVVDSAYAERIVNDVWSACEYMHRELGLIHGDVKLNNICIDEHDRAVLIDFDRTTELGDRSVMKRNTEYHHGSTEDGVAMAPMDDLYACIVVAIKLLRGIHHVVRTLNHSQMFDGQLHVRDEWVLRMVRAYNARWSCYPTIVADSRKRS